jgi:CRISPR-associated protein Cmr2
VTVEGDYARLLQELRSRASLGEGPLSLVSFTIAGVQTFLDSARTTRDVWNGSYLMSYLMWKATEKALNEVLSRSGVSHPCSDTQRYVLIPAIEKQPFWQHWVYGTATNLDVAHFPNTVLLLVPGDAKAARGMAGQMELAVESAWNEICAAVASPSAHCLNAGVAGELWKYQLEWRRGPDGAAWQQIFETYTSVCQVPADAGALNQLTERLGLDPERNPAGRLFQLSMRLLAARKALRDFEQVAHEGHRCSLCGSRSALANYPRRSDSKRSEAPLHFSAEALREFWQEVRRIKGLEYAFRDGERLCAVCVVRRLAPVCFFQKTFPAIKDRILFPSTSTIATAAWVRDVVRAAQLDDGVNVSLAASVSRWIFGNGKGNSASRTLQRP